MPDLSKIKLDNTVYNLKDAALRERYGVCDTAADTATKTVTIDSVTSLYEGLYILVKFANANTASNPTLQVNSFTAAAIKKYGTTAPSTSAAGSWSAGSVQLLVYDGTYWQQADWNNTTYSSMTVAEITAGTGTTARIITPARLKTAVETWAPVKSVNGDTGSVIVDQLQTTAGSDNTEYNLIGTNTSNTNNAAVDIYNPGLISFSKYDSNFARLTLGSTTTPGQLRLYTSADSASGYIDLKSASTSTNTRTITLPDASGTVALTSDIPNVSSWALAANKPSYTFSELTTTPTSLGGYGITDAYTKTEVDGMVSGVLHYKGTKATVSALPSSGNTTGDVWHITADGSEYAWDGSAWQELGTAVDLSGYVPTSRTVNGKALSSDISLTASDVEALPSSTTYVSSFNGSTGAITYTAPVTSVNGQTGAVSLTIPSAVTNHYNNDPCDGNIMLNGQNSATSTVTTTYTSGALTFSNTGVLRIGKAHSSEGSKGSINLSNSAGTSQGYTIITPSATTTVTLTLPTSTGTLALTTDIPSVPSWALESTKPSYTASEVGALPDTTTYVSSFNGDTGAITYTAPVTSVNGQTGAVTITDTNTTYTLSISGNVITLTPSSGTAQTITLPVYNGGVE